MSEDKTTLSLDVVVVGAGLSGVATLYRLRKAGYNAKIFDSGSAFGGVWHWNRYPGARVDSEYPLYQLNLSEVFPSWDWTEKFGAQPELQAYFNHVGKVLDLEKDTFFNSTVTDAIFDAASSKWTIVTAKHVAVCKYVVFATGALHRSYLPDIQGIENFKGQVIHTSAWPEDIELSGKRVAVIGAGATGVQVVQELAKKVDKLFVAIRNPPYCLPMGQEGLSKQQNKEIKEKLAGLLSGARDTLAGYPTAPLPVKTFDHTPEQRQAHWEDIWSRKGFSFFQSSYMDLLTDVKANREAYDFWATKVRSRISDPAKRKILAPEEPPYPWGTRRTPLDQDFYECIDQANVELINLKTTPIESMTDVGMVTSDGVERTFDVIIMATGFDSFTGSLNAINIVTKDGKRLSDIWRNEGCKTHLGIFVHGLPNAFLLYSPQSPSAFSNGPTIIECQADFVLDSIQEVEKMNAKSIEATTESEEEWTTMCDNMASATLLPLGGGWWSGANIPGKKSQNFNFVGGLNTYERMCKEALASRKGLQIV